MISSQIKNSINQNNLTLNSPWGGGPCCPPPPDLGRVATKIYDIWHIHRTYREESFVIMQMYANYMHKLHFNLYKIYLKVLKLETCLNFVANLSDKFLKKTKLWFVFLISYVFYCFFNFIYISMFFLLDFYCFLFNRNSFSIEYQQVLQ